MEENAGNKTIELDMGFGFAWLFNLLVRFYAFAKLCSV